MGSDFGQSAEWNYNKNLDWHLLQYPEHRGIQMVVRDLNKLYQEIPSLALVIPNPTALSGSIAPMQRTVF